MPTVDVHTHVYPPSYMSLLRSRTTVPYIRNFPDAPDSARLIILPGEDSASTPSTSRGRPIGPEYHSIAHKLAFMDAHHIAASVISLANPWLDFLEPAAAPAAASSINAEIESLCAQHPTRLYHFGTLPLSAPAPAVCAEIAHLASLPHCRGVIMGTSGLGAGLDDARLEPVWAALAAREMLVFIHPHYGLPSDVYGPRAAADYGHVLPLAIGFPVETTVAVARMLLGGVWERHPALTVLLAHSGGTLPFLAGRIESCVAHDGHLKKEGRLERMRSLWDVLKRNVYLDAVVYSEVGLRAAVEASGQDRIMFGTDHPFFPPLDGEETEWLSVKTNYAAIKKAFDGDESAAEAVLGGNAARILKLDL
ncbi:uracil-5-carboxylate decarboxylase [Diplodia corticola]|uniref:Uracil-5-carboxylate decarboxylase n=1 Tax=Diplodia corticola TaxID=236234 RepID=A0A1J9QPV2_9PEZI|nr:uracil-5-carboxylate decarboxylase [Diplodia corticola]OJD30488.1 uracil-5-carboxylate decarboxylase [Diplodia corticola]